MCEKLSKMFNTQPMDGSPERLEESFDEQLAELVRQLHDKQARLNLVRKILETRRTRSMTAVDIIERALKALMFLAIVLCAPAAQADKGWLIPNAPHDLCPAEISVPPTTSLTVVNIGQIHSQFNMQFVSSSSGPFTHWDGKVRFRTWKKMANDNLWVPVSTKYDYCLGLHAGDRFDSADKSSANVYLTYENDTPNALVAIIRVEATFYRRDANVVDWDQYGSPITRYGYCRVEDVSGP